MSMEQVLTKTREDIYEMLDTVGAVKGENYRLALAHHMNLLSLMTAVKWLMDSSDNDMLNTATNKLLVESCAQSMHLITKLAQMSEQDIEELMGWGDRLHQVIQTNYKTYGGQAS